MALDLDLLDAQLQAAGIDPLVAAKKYAARVSLTGQPNAVAATAAQPARVTLMQPGTHGEPAPAIDRLSLANADRQPLPTSTRPSARSSATTTERIGPTVRKCSASS
jgi:hypothetical protein